MSMLAVPRAALVGAVLMYLFDPQRGRIRRSKVRDQLTHLRRKVRTRALSAKSDAEHRIQGAVERVRHPPEDRVDPRVLAARVRTRLGRIVTHSSAIEVDVDDAQRVTLRGPILEPEAEPLLRETRAIAGVHEVADQLDRHATADIPSLQGRPARPISNLWPPSIQGAALIGGTTLAGWGLVRRGLSGSLGFLGGLVLALRGGLNRPVAQIGRLAIGREPIEVEKTIHVRAPIEDVFALWSRVENFPRIMEHVREVQLDDVDPKCSHWVVDGPAGRSLSFDVVITKVDRPHELGWTTPPNQPIEHTGVVRFAGEPDGTRVQVHMTYRPPGGVLGHAVARLLGWDPKARLDDDMVRMKGLLEDGRTRAHGERVWMQDLAR